VQGERGLAAAVRAQHGDPLAVLHHEVHAGEGLRAVGEGVGEAGDPQRRPAGPGGGGRPGPAAQAAPRPFPPLGRPLGVLVGGPAGPPAAWLPVGRGERQGRPQLLLEPREPDAVDAEVAVHPDVTGDGLAMALDDERRQPRVGAQVVAHHDDDVRVGLRPAPGPFDDPVHEHAGEEEQRHHGDAGGPEPAALVERLLDVRVAHRREGGLDRPQTSAVLQQAGQLHHVGAGIRVGGPPAHEHDGLAGVVAGCRRRRRCRGPTRWRLAGRAARAAGARREVEGTIG
jgi:hypothetical protein